ncbi:hypothetical protein BDW60DRAFT_203816 [Aspergillus nidulans var. acristatus]
MTLLVADINAPWKSENSNSALCVACSAVGSLSGSYCGMEPMFTSIGRSSGDVGMVKFLLENDDYTAKDHPLAEAARYGHNENVRDLLDGVANPDAGHPLHTLQKTIKE